MTVASKQEGFVFEPHGWLYLGAATLKRVHPGLIRTSALGVCAILSASPLQSFKSHWVCKDQVRQLIQFCCKLMLEAKAVKARHCL